MAEFNGSVTRALTAITENLDSMSMQFDTFTMTKMDDMMNRLRKLEESLSPVPDVPRQHAKARGDLATGILPSTDIKPQVFDMERRLVDIKSLMLDMRADVVGSLPSKHVYETSRGSAITSGQTLSPVPRFPDLDGWPSLARSITTPPRTVSPEPRSPEQYETGAPSMDAKETRTGIVKDDSDGNPGEEMEDTEAANNDTEEEDIDEEDKKESHANCLDFDGFAEEDDSKEMDTQEDIKGNCDNQHSRRLRYPDGKREEVLRRSQVRREQRRKDPDWPEKRAELLERARHRRADRMHARASRGSSS